MKKKVKLYQFESDYVKVAESVIMQACINQNERELVFFLKLKRFNRSGHIYNPNFKQHPIEKSKRTFNRRINQLLSMEWATLTPKGIQLISIDKLPKADVNGRDRHIRLNNDERLNYVLIRALILQISERKQKFAAKQHSDLKPNIILSVMTNGSFATQSRDIRKDVSMSGNSFANKINRSRTTAYRLMGKWRTDKIYKSAVRYLYNPNAKKNYKIFNGLKYQKIANQFETNLPKYQKKVKFDSIEQKVVNMYCNDCF
jgi:hypothetical protein